MKQFYFLIALVLILPTMAMFQTTNTISAPRPYQVVPGDKLEGKVLGESDFDFTVVVDETGSFTLPFVEKKVTAKCRTEQDILEQVKTHYSRFLKEPMVSVRVTERKPPAPVTVSGQVRSPQRVEMRRQARLLELISFSGGFNEDAGGMVQLFRTQIPTCADEQAREEWNAQTNSVAEVPSWLYTRSSIVGGRNESNPIVYPGDIINVEKAAPVYMTGMVVQSTGVYIKEGGLSLSQAIAMVGGVREKAKTKDVKIYRVTNDSPQDRKVINVNLDLIKKGEQKDVLLEPYDIVEVDRAKDSFGVSLLKIVTGAGRQAVSGFATGGSTRILY